MVMEGVAGRARTYGALELKRAYQHNLFLALVLAGMLHALFIGGAVWYGTQIHSDVAPSVIVPPHLEEFRLERQPKVIPEAPLPGGGGSLVRTGIPVPVPGEIKTDDIALPTREDLRKLIRGVDTGNGGYGLEHNWGIIQESDVLPPSSVFVAMEVGPLVVRKVAPEYPEFARQSGVEGTVDVRVGVDRHGHVRDAFVYRCSAPKLGLEEAALGAVRKWEFRPALQNHKPIGAWVNVTVVFRLR